MNKYKLIALATVFVAFEQVPAQVTFTSETKLIIVNVSVKDKNGVPIPNLTKEDFNITEDNGRSRRSRSSSSPRSLPNDLLAPVT